MNRRALTRRGFVVAAALLGATRTGYCRSPVVVASKLDLEGAVIGHIFLLALDAAGIPTTSRLRLGPTAIVRAAILAGAVDLTIEYTGNAAMFFHLEGDPVWKDRDAGYARAAELDRTTNGLVWLPPAPADNSWVIAVPASLVREAGLRTMLDFAAYARAGGRIKLAASAEFVESPAGLPAFEATYGFRLGADRLLVLSGGETSATMKAAADGISGVNAAMAYGTDGAFAALDLVALEDIFHAGPAYAPAPVVRAETLDAYPQIPEVLAPVSSSLDLATLRRLNEQVAVYGKPAGAVAQEFVLAARLFDRGPEGAER
jgi:osmoprotectant transport system substrate-binding protein